MSETADSSKASTAPPKKRPGGLNGMLLADLKAMAAALGVPGTSTMKKAQLVAAIKAIQDSVGPPRSAKSKPQTPAGSGDGETSGDQAPPSEQRADARDEGSEPSGDQRPSRTQRQPRNRSRGQQAQGQAEAGAAEAPAAAQPETSDAAPAAADQASDQGGSRRTRSRAGGQQAGDTARDNQRGGDQRSARTTSGPRSEGAADAETVTDQHDARSAGQQEQAPGDRGGDDDGAAGSRRNRRRRGRDRERPGRNRAEPDTQVLDDDVLVPAAGILDVLDNYAFVRTSGYLPGADDVYLSLSMVKKFGLRRGDALVGQVRQPREGERKEKFNPMVRVDSVNGRDPEEARDRPEFAKFTPLHADERLRLETDAGNLTGRLIDLVAPVGKGQRALIAAPPKSGKTTVLQSIATSITANNPECHLMVVLIDERPEEVTDFQRLIKGEVIASTFDRPASDHITVAELAIERAKRLVELGHDVVVLLDSITRLGRAYNLAAPASGRILPGGVEAAALYPPKKFFGAARNVEHGGSLTILATAQIETGSKTDEVFFEEFIGTSNLELRLRRELADKALFPAVDVGASSTGREELLLSEDELAARGKLRSLVNGREPQPALELLLERLKKAETNVEFLKRI